MTKKKVVNDDAEKLNKDLDKTNLTKEQIENAKKEMGEAVKQLQNPKKIIEEENKKIEEFSKNPLANILNLLIQDHAGTEKEQKTALTGLLYVLRIMALKDRSGILKVTGKSSAGKTHLVKTLLQLFPQHWIKEIGDASEKAIRYIDWKEERILYIKEGAGSENNTETLKLMDSGDGGFKFLVTKGTVKDGFYTEEITIPVKFIITTSAKDIFDNELDNRMFGISIDESEEQTFNVLLHRCKHFAGHLPVTNYNVAKSFISNLKTFDKIVVPYSYEFLNIINKNIRARRDIDKLISLCQTSAFINQHNRPTVEKNGVAKLFTTPEDAYNVFTLSFSSFEETTTGFTSRMEELYNLITKDNDVTYRYLIKNSSLKYKQQVKREVEKLDDLGLIEINTDSNKHTISRLDDIKKMKKDFDDHKNNFLVYTLVDLAVNECEDRFSLKWYDINEEINRNKNRNKPSQKNDLNHKNRNKNRNKSVTKIKDFYKKEELENIFQNTNKLKASHPCYGHVTVFVTPIQQEKMGVKKAKCNIVTRGEHNDQKNDIFNLEINGNMYGSRYDVTPQKNKQKVSQNDRFKHIFDKIKENKDSGYKINDDFLFNNFKKEDIEYLIKTNTLVKQGNGEYVIGGK
ncbi:MAG: hypothetical protein V5A68_06960 [Candidatus Thermoplasmatota archaeon]